MDKYMGLITSLLVLLFLLYRQRQIRQVRDEIRTVQSWVVQSRVRRSFLARS